MARLKDLSPSERDQLLTRFRSTRPKTRGMLHKWVRLFCGVYIPKTRVCEGHSSPFDVFCDSYFAKQPGTIWMGSRGLVGKTFTAAVLGYTEACTMGASITLLGGSLEQSKNLHGYLTNTHARSGGTFWEAPDAPRHLLTGPPTNTEVRLTNGGKVKALTASPNSVRGPHPHRVRCIAEGTLITTSEGKKCIENINGGDTVLGWNGYQLGWGKVSAVHDNGVAPTVDLALSGGKRLTCTADHKLLTDRGWRQADQLIPGEHRLISEPPGVLESTELMYRRQGTDTRVYDLCVPDLHSYVAAGVVVHNCDEIDEMDVAIFDAATGQAMGADGIKDHFLATSTRQHPEGTFQYAWDLAEELGWGCHETCFRENMEPHGWLSHDQVERKKRSVPYHRWLIEYENQSPGSEDLIFTEEVIDGLFDKSLGEFDGAMGEEIIVIPPRYPKPDSPPLILPDDHYANDNFTHGTDWGKTRDFSVCITMKKNRGGPDIMAAFGKWGREPWHNMADRHNERVRRYGGKSVHDVTGIGSNMAELLTVPSEGYDFHRVKETIDMKNSWVKACETGEILYADVKSFRRDCRRLTTDNLYGHKHTPDTVVAACLERYARSELAWEVLIGS